MTSTAALLKVLPALLFALAFFPSPLNLLEGRRNIGGRSDSSKTGK